MPSPWERVRLGRKNLLAVFEEEAFTYEFRSMRLLGGDILLQHADFGTLSEIQTYAPTE
jgi:hypothetical protein